MPGPLHLPRKKQHVWAWVVGEKMFIKRNIWVQRNSGLSQGLLANESTLRMRWPKYWSFSFNISPSNEHPELISFRMDWLDLLAVQGILKSLLPTPQFKSINSSALSFLYSPTLTSIHDHWKSHSLD